MQVWQSRQNDIEFPKFKFRHTKQKQTVMRGPMHVKRNESEKHPFRGTTKEPEKGQE